jgi:hypothetical protein
MTGRNYTHRGHKLRFLKMGKHNSLAPPATAAGMPRAQRCETAGQVCDRMGDIAASKKKPLQIAGAEWAFQAAAPFA